MAELSTARPTALANSIGVNGGTATRQRFDTRTTKDGAGGRTRTDMSLTSPDFESGAYTNFATPAARAKMISRALRESQPEGDDQVAD